MGISIRCQKIVHIAILSRAGVYLLFITHMCHASARRHIVPCFYCAYSIEVLARLSEWKQSRERGKFSGVSFVCFAEECALKKIMIIGGFSYR